MKIKLLAICYWACLYHFSIAQEAVKVWESLSDVSYVTRYVAEYDENMNFPIFSEKLMKLNGQELEISGYVLPVVTEEGAYVLSKYPYAECFFCGGAGPESVIEVYFDGEPGRLRTDQFITIRGILELNAMDIYHLNYIFRESKIIKKSKL
jgi:hypothetical protein